MTVNGSDICADCGLCCDGTVFPNAHAEPHEAERLAQFGLTFNPGENTFDLPCPRLDGPRCTIYNDRFITCRAFRCELLKAFMDGSTSLDEARASIATAKELLADALQVAPDARYAPRRFQIIIESITQSFTAEPDEAARLVDVHQRTLAAERFIAATFRKPDAGDARE